MSDAEVPPGSGVPAGSGPAPVDPRIPAAGDELADPQAALRAVGETSLRLLAGAVPKPRLEQLRRVVEQGGDSFPWQLVTRELLADPIDPQRLMQQGLVAQRDWIARGGRTAKGPGIVRRTKGFVARFVAQLVFGVIFAVVLIAGLILLQIKIEWLDIYQLVPWVKGLFGG